MGEATCPECGSERLDRVEVDIGVGVQCGPWSCTECGWGEDRGPEFLSDGEEA